MPLSFRSVLGLLLALAVGGCGDTFVDPFLREADTLSVTGIFLSTPANAASETQALRVQAVRTDLAAPTDPDDPALAFEAQVVTYDTFTEDSTFWDRRLAAFTDGTYGYLYTADFRPRPGGRYELFVRRDNDAEARGVITIPAAPEAEVLPWDRRGEITAAAWPAFGADQPTARADIACGFDCGFELDFPATVRPLGDGRFAVEGDLDTLQRDARALYPGDPENGIPPTPLTLEQVTLSVRLLGEEWARAQDPTANTLDGAYGFVGGATTVVTNYQVPAEAARAAGFQN